MTDDLDIYRAAKLIIDRHGDDAVLQATGRSDFLLEEGAAEGAAIWRRIMVAIEELQREKRPDEAVN